MRLLRIVGVVFALLVITACGADNASKLEKAPEYIQETFPQYQAMNMVITELGNGVNYDVATGKYPYDSEKIEKFYEDTKNSSDASEEETSVAMAIYLMVLKLDTMQLEYFNSTLSGDVVDFEQDLYELQKPQYQLNQIYGGKYELDINEE